MIFPDRGSFKFFEGDHFLGRWDDLIFFSRGGVEGLGKGS